MALPGLPQLLINAVTSLFKGFGKKVFGSTPKFDLVKKKGKSLTQELSSTQKKILIDSKTNLGNKLNFANKIAKKFEKIKVDLIDQTLGINSQSILDRHKSIKSLKKSGATLKEILQLEKSSGLSERSVKEFSDSKLNTTISMRDTLTDQTPSDDELNQDRRDLDNLSKEIPEGLGIIGEYISKSWESLSRQNEFHSNESIKKMVELDQIISESERENILQVLNSLDAMDLMNAKNLDSVLDLVTEGSNLSSSLLAKVGELTEEGSEGIQESIQNLSQNLDGYMTNLSNSIGMMSDLKSEESLVEDQEEPIAFSELLKGNSLLIDLVSSSQKNPMEVLTAMDSAFTETARAFGEEAGFWGMGVKRLLDLTYESVKGVPYVGKMVRGMSDILGNILGFPNETGNEDTGEGSGAGSEIKTIRSYGISRDSSKKELIDTSIDTEVAQIAQAQEQEEIKSSTLNTSVERIVEIKEPIFLTNHESIQTIDNTKANLPSIRFDSKEGI